MAVCRHCGLETGGDQDHVTQGGCIEALRSRVKELEEDLLSQIEVTFHKESNLWNLYQEKKRELEDLRDRLEKKEEVAQAIRKALRRGGKKTWEKLIDLLKKG